MKLLQLISIVIFATACGGQNSDTGIHRVSPDVKNPIESKKPDDLFSSIDILTIDMPDDTFIRTVDDIKFFDRKFFLFDRMASNIHILDDKGVHIKTIDSRGEGPEEYRNLSFFDVNQKQKSVDLMDVRSGIITRFDFEGNFIEKITARLICRDFAVGSDGTYYFFCPDELPNPLPNLELPSGVITLSEDGNFNSVVKLGDVAYVPMITGKSFFTTKNGLGLLTTYADTLYQFIENGTVEKTVIDYGVQMDEKALLTTSFDLQEANFPFLKFSPSSFGNYFTYTTTYKGRGVNVLINKNDNKAETFQFWDTELIGVKIPIVGFGNGDYLFAPISNETVLQSKQYYRAMDKDNLKAIETLEQLEQRINDNNGNPLLLVFKI